MGADMLNRQMEHFRYILPASISLIAVCGIGYLLLRFQDHKVERLKQVIEQNSNETSVKFNKLNNSVKAIGTFVQHDNAAQECLNEDIEHFETTNADSDGNHNIDVDRNVENGMEHAAMLEAQARAAAYSNKLSLSVQFDNQQRNADWAEVKENTIIDMFEAWKTSNPDALPVIPAFSIEDLECKSTICRLVLSYNYDANYEGRTLSLQLLAMRGSPGCGFSAFEMDNETGMQEMYLECNQ